MSKQEHISDQPNLAKKIQQSHGDDDKEDYEQGSILKVLVDDHDQQQEVDGDDDQAEYYCRTPTSSDHKIPSIQSCPPTPRKPNTTSGRLFSQKRKLSDLHFFETTGREEVESFFRSNLFQFPRVKKRCMSI